MPWFEGTAFFQRCIACCQGWGHVIVDGTRNQQGLCKKLPTAVLSLFPSSSKPKPPYIIANALRDASLVDPFLVLNRRPLRVAATTTSTLTLASVALT